jgi:hypothetical protein
MLVITNKTQVRDQNINSSNISVQDLMIVCGNKTHSWMLKTFPSFMNKINFVKGVYTYFPFIINHYFAQSVCPLKYQVFLSAVVGSKCLHHCFGGTDL